MENKNDNGSKTQQGFVVPQKPIPKKPRGYDDTIPAGVVSYSSPKEQSDDLITSASTNTILAAEAGAGVVTLSGERVEESLARELIVRRMAKEGIELASDIAFSYGDLLVTLDGYDEKRQIGYQFISHAGEDVVTDFDPQVERRLQDLAVAGIAHVLVIHDHKATDSDAVIAEVERFLANLSLNPS